MLGVVLALRPVRFAEMTIMEHSRRREKFSNSGKEADVVIRASAPLLTLFGYRLMAAGLPLLETDDEKNVFGILWHSISMLLVWIVPQLESFGNIL